MPKQETISKNLIIEHSNYALPKNLDNRTNEFQVKDDRMKKIYPYKIN